MKKKKTILILTAAVLALLVCTGTYLFISDVRAQLWQNSISTITESTQQGANALNIQFQEDFDDLRSIAGRLGTVTAPQTENALRNFNAINPDVAFYRASGGCFLETTVPDQFVSESLPSVTEQEGLLKPHISSVTGKNVFNAYIKAKLADGTDGYLVKEYGVEETAEQFTLSFYNNTGFSYLVDKNGTVLIRSSHVNSNKTLQNLFDMLPQEENDPEVIDKFRQSLLESRSGWARFQYSEESTVFCYTPLTTESDWYLISIVPESVITAQTTNILTKAVLLLGAVLLGIALILTVYLYNIRKAHRKLENQTAFITHLYNSVPEGIALITIDEPYRFAQLNQEGARLLGYSRADDRTLQDMPMEAALRPGEQEEVWQVLRKASEDGQKHAFTHQLLRTDGCCIWASSIVERTEDANGVPVLIATFHDITKEKLAEDEREREKLMERRSLISAISSAYPMIMRLNLSRDELNILYSSPTIRLSQPNEHTCSGMFESFEPMLHPDYRQDYRERLSPQRLLQKLIQEKGEVFLEARGRFNNNVYHWLSFQVLYVDNPFSEDCIAILLVRCIDEQKHEEEQSRQALQTALEAANAASQAKGQFLSNMSHDIRTPLNAIVGMTAIAKAHLDERERIIDCLQKIELSSSHLLSLINDVLDMSKIESGKLAIHEEPIHLTELFSSVLEIVRPQARDNGLTIEANITRMRNEQVLGDSLRIRQILLNIISNAVKYTPAGGNIRLELSQSEPYQEYYGNYQFRCSDTGIGMEEAFLAKLFLPFERSRDSTASKISGTGLGMTITKNILDMMGGNIQVESEPGEGSTFTVTLRLKLQENDSNPAENTPDTWEAPSLSRQNLDEPDYSGKRLLLVEDNELNLEIARELIGMTGVQIDEANDGAQAVQKIEDSPPGYYNLVLMDVQMPVMNGYDATKQIRKLNRPDATTLPIIAMTANAFAEDVEMAGRAGMNGHISKPIDMAVIHKVLKKWL